MVYLVGAGPGDPGLMTCRGAEVLRECEAVVYDRLGTSGLLELVPEDCEKIYVGKKPGSHSKKQEEINAILIDTAKRFDRVVRLKGGDPFVFGRGGEEVLALHCSEFRLLTGRQAAVFMYLPATQKTVMRQALRTFIRRRGQACFSWEYRILRRLRTN